MMAPSSSSTSRELAITSSSPHWSSPLKLPRRETNKRKRTDGCREHRELSDREIEIENILKGRKGIMVQFQIEKMSKARKGIMD
ncbi:hypothetical protein Bca4012_030458 [Brassica carinata]|uniref:Uncharacterized protein n=2 Tax=Brassica TaxID=3705 RepID=A0A3P6BZZ1_BRAOL|nr:unnamed protein product [Brassica napus]VDD08456.1 unnamed protein product [Brassica oleracea]